MKKWEILSQTTDSSQLTIDTIIQLLLQNRGLENKEDLETFLNPKLENVTIDAVGIDKKQVQKTVDRIKQAIDKKEQIIVYGDYDVDGLTASAILWETLYHTLKAKVTPYIPHRIDEGYGISIKGVDNVIEKFPETKLIITVDNGIVANAAVEYTNQKGIDVIITDHHTLGPAAPHALAIVHTTKLCGAGIAYLLSHVLKKEIAGIEEKQDDLLELATLGTIADLVPLNGANRIIVKHGLEKLCRTKRMGLIELFKEAGCNNGKIGVYEVGHVIAPRLNATGRMTSAMDSLRLLCTKDRARAEELAGLLGTVNKERQQVMADAAKHASLSVQARQELKKLLVVSHDTYPEGVIGLVAGRLVEEFYRPSIVIAKGEKLSKGSVRSISGFNIIEFLRQFSEYFVNIGGHPMAAGFTIETDKIAALQEKLEQFVHEGLQDGLLTRKLRVDCELPLSLVTERFYKALQVLAPFGMANPEPVFVSRGVQIADMRILGKDGKHLRLTVSGPSAEMEAIAFGFGEKAADMHIGDTIDLAYTVDINEWNGRRKLQLKVKDILLHATH